MTRYHTVVVHQRPHVEEIYGLWLLFNFGIDRYPGIEEATVKFFGSGGESLTDLSSDELELAGVIAIGVGGGKLDEHPSTRSPKKGGECAATLTAKDLDVDKNPALQKITDFIKRGDLYGGNQPFDLATVTKAMHAAYPNDPQIVIDWDFEAIDGYYQQQLALVAGKKQIVDVKQLQDTVIAAIEATHPASPQRDWLVRALVKNQGPFDLIPLAVAIAVKHPERAVPWAVKGADAKYQQQLNFLSAKEELRYSETKEIRGPRGKLTMVVGISNNEEFNKAARSSGAAVVVQRHPAGEKLLSGSTQIFTAQKFNLDLGDVLAMLRMEEQELKGEIVTTDWNTLRQEGKVLGVPEWYFQRSGQMVFNRSLSATDAPLTQISLDRIVEIVEIGLNPRYFEPSRQEVCLAGICNSTRANPCPLYKYGFNRCKQVRNAQYRQTR